MDIDSLVCMTTGIILVNQMSKDLNLDQATGGYII